jgi:hypothetical protein
VRLDSHDEPTVVRFLARHPSQHAYLLGQVARGALSDPDLAHVFVGWFEVGRLVAVASLGQNLVVSRTPSNRALIAFAAHARELRLDVRVVVGPDREVDVFMTHFGRADVRLERGGQPLMEVDLKHLARSARSVELRPGQTQELQAIWDADGAMILEELGFSPFSSDPNLHRFGCERRIQEWRTWVVGAPAGSIAFKVDQSAVSSRVVQLAGVFTHPAHRRQGLAFRALGEMCHLLLREVPRVSLYVNPDNLGARGLYAHLGFCEVGVVRSAWLDHDP